MMSSKKKMENKLDILQTIQKVDTPDGLYERFMEKIERPKLDIIPITWVRIAAASICILICSECFIIFKKSNTNKEQELLSIAPIQNNNLYYE